MKHKNSTRYFFWLLAVLLYPIEQASANPHFTFVNNTSVGIQVAVYNGDDSKCLIAEKTIHVDAGKTDTIGCQGNGTGRCRIGPFDHGSMRTYCTKMYDHCNSSAMNIDDGQTLTVSPSDTGNYTCTLE